MGLELEVKTGSTDFVSILLLSSIDFGVAMNAAGIVP